jgi:hypothetical protein
MSTGTLSDRFRPNGETLALAGLVVTTELLLVLGYVVALNVQVRDWTLYAVPFVWINVGLWAVVRTDPQSAPARKRLLAAAVAGGYFLLLAYFGGLFGPGNSPVTAYSVEFLDIPPGWSPALLYNGPIVSLALLPYKMVGYLALAYLVYATALDASNAVVGGVLGLFSCVSCSFPIIAGVVTGIVGGGGALAGLATSSTYLLSTVVFVVTVGLLYWRPAVGKRLGRPTA